MNGLALATIDTFKNKIYHGDALTLANSLPSGSINTIVTSPPYYGLRDYGVQGQIGLEDTIEAYVNRLVVLFRELRRGLRDDGTLWLNLGDSYSADRPYQVKDNKNRDVGNSLPMSSKKLGLRPKNLIGIPWRVAFALQQDGWILRQDIIWHKPAPMPESVKDRCTKAHEYVFLFAKCERYYFDSEAIADPLSRVYTGTARDGGLANRRGMKHSAIGNQALGPNLDLSNRSTRNKRSVWTIAPQPMAEAHFATFPPKLIEPMILAGSPSGGIVYDPFMGSGTTALVAREKGRHFAGSELNAEYIEIAERRLAKPYTPDMFLGLTA